MLEFHQDFTHIRTVEGDETRTCHLHILLRPRGALTTNRTRRKCTQDYAASIIASNML